MGQLQRLQPKDQHDLPRTTASDNDFAMNETADATAVIGPKNDHPPTPTMIQAIHGVLVGLETVSLLSEPGLWLDTLFKIQLTQIHIRERKTKLATNNNDQMLQQVLGEPQIF